MPRQFRSSTRRLGALMKFCSEGLTVNGHCCIEDSEAQVGNALNPWRSQCVPGRQISKLQGKVVGRTPSRWVMAIRKEAVPKMFRPEQGNSQLTLRIY
jgi:hypothetical protein